MKALTFDIFSKASQFSSGWVDYSTVGLVEGVSMYRNQISLDFEEDHKGDIIKLHEPKPLAPVRKAGIPIYRGYYLERVAQGENTDGTENFMKEIKTWGLIDDENLSRLLAHTYSPELATRQVAVIFIAGSSDPLSVRIAETLKRDYYPECKIIDVMRKYYGVDPNDIIDWDKYKKADPVTQRNIDTYLNQYSSHFTETGRRIPPAREFTGYIKKSAGLQSGGRRLLKPGHEIDDTIIQSITQAESEWLEKYEKDPRIARHMALRYRPSYLLVDDTMIEGSTMRGIFQQMVSVIGSQKFSKFSSSMIEKSLFGYCLFSKKG